MLYICYPKCTTCAKAQNWLDSHDLTYELRNIKEKKPSYDELKEWLRLSGLPLKRFFNTSGQLYRAMELKDRLGEMSEEEQLRLLASDGMLVKRPLLVSEETVFVGFREKEWETLL